MAAGEWLQMHEPESTDRILQLCQDGINASMCSGIVLKNNHTSVNYMSYPSIAITSHLICIT
jgi:hypothetical protein